MLTLVQEQAGKTQAHPEGTPLFLGHAVFIGIRVFSSHFGHPGDGMHTTSQGIWKEKARRDHATY